MIPKCGCGQQAEYLVYEHEEPHCKGCMLDAIDCETFVMVRKPTDWSEWYERTSESNRHARKTAG